MKNRRSKWAGALVLIALCAAVSIWWLRTEAQEKALQIPLPQAGLKLSAWITDWQWKTGITDGEQLRSELEEIYLFAAYFNQEDELHFTSDFEKGLAELQKISRNEERTRRILTIVNDRFDVDGTAEQKDSKLISRIVATPVSRSLHIEQILAVVSQHGFRGVELDYEKVHKEDWANLCALYKELYERLQADGFSLRIVLEPGISSSSMELLPAGPDYVLMAYNLYGGHSGPGPKADYTLIRKLADKLHGIPGEHAIALSVGGFDWAQDGKVVSLTEKRAVELTRLISEEPKRDPSSGALYFEYTDDQGSSHTVWYADGKTLSSWMDTARDEGITKIALWRLGDMEEETLKQLQEYRLQSESK